MDATVILGASTEGNMSRAPIRLRDLGDGSFALAADPALLAAIERLTEAIEATQEDASGGKVSRVKSIADAAGGLL